MKKIILSLLLTLVSCFCFSQEVEMADGLRSEGKIYVVVSVLVTILLGLILYLIMIDRKVSDIEKKLKQK
ncbi:MAG: CcmD family protein [Bacteroidetes bacterium]|nr:CcmD family protein [Bacteroidota bacterium]